MPRREQSSASGPRSSEAPAAAGGLLSAVLLFSHLDPARRPSAGHPTDTFGSTFEELFLPATVVWLGAGVRDRRETQLCGGGEALRGGSDQ